MKRKAVLAIAFLVSALSGAHAQFLTFDQSNSENPTEAPKRKMELRFARLLFSVRAGGRSRAPGFSLMPAGSGSASMSVSPLPFAPNLPVLGGGTVGRLTKWTGITSSNSFLGDSTIFESKFGLVGIGTDAPTSKLTVAGTIQSLTGGFQFPDGTVQTTAGIAPNQVVRSLNGLVGDLTLVPGTNVSITPGTNSLTISATGLLSAISHDATLTGNGTIGSPLGVAIPLKLIAPISMGGIIEATVAAEGGSTESGFGGDAIYALGGASDGHPMLPFLLFFQGAQL